MRKAHVFNSSTNFTYCWYDDFYIRLQPAMYGNKAYARIQTVQCQFSKREFNSLLELGVLRELTRNEFEIVFRAAMDVLESSMQG